MKILLTGGNGQLGRALALRLTSRHTVVVTDQDELDVRDLPAVRACLHEERPDLVLHLAALTQVDACESDPERTFEINTLGTRYVVQGVAEIGARLLFVSTDYVFDGAADRPYREYDSRRPLNVYGWSKLHGERMIEARLSRHFIVRTSGLFGPGGANFPEAILRQEAQQGKVTVVTDQICRPTYTGHLADGIACLVESEDYGIYHIASAGAVSWFDFAREILTRAGRDARALAPITSEALHRPARRPARSVLDTHAFELTHGHVLPHWREGLAEFLDQRAPESAGG